jgi:hypothetical protein
MSATIRPPDALRLLGGAAAVETLLLVRLVTHPAGGWGENLGQSLATLSLWAVGPLAAAALSPTMRILRGDQKRLARPTFVAISLIGPASIAMALLIYGHGMAGPLFIGLLAQWVLAVRTWFLRSAPNDARAPRTL